MLAKTLRAAAAAMILAVGHAATAEPRLVLLMNDQPGDRPAVVTAIDLSPDGSRLVAGGDDHCLRLWDTESGERVATLHGHDDWVRAARFTPGGDRLATVAADHSVCLWAADGSAAYDTKLHGAGPLSAVAIHPEGDRLATVGFGDALRMFRIDEDTAPDEFGCPCEDTRSVVFSPDGRWLAAAGRNGQVRLWDLVSSGGPRDLPGDGRRVRALAFSPSGKTLAVGGDGPAVQLWNLGEGAAFGDELPEAPEELITRPGKTHSLAFVDDSLLAVGGTSNAIHLWDTQSRSPVKQLEGHTGTVAAMAVSADGRVLVSGAFDATVRVWDLQDPLAARTAAASTAETTTR